MECSLSRSQRDADRGLSRRRTHTGDSAKEIELFLASSRFYNPLRLGRKCEAPTFKQDSVQRLYTEFPKTLDLWDKREARFRLYSRLDLYPLSKLFEGIDREDGSRAVLPDATKVTLARALESIPFFQRNKIEWLREEGLRDLCWPFARLDLVRYVIQTVINIIRQVLSEI
ncbi:hypothetical protein DFH08DRAFT_929333 [Mycena albidolilacea]|uniref:Uncharacterized protein n=1 Tax=Mycena albidolilacea TaxID=1033008 RepID=A0AAD7F2K8_9AGAR|nr:hypothetical protein DFH08DRAFT_929333 [Mycena albidolilacea]